MKLGTRIHHVSGHYGSKGFQGQRSEVNAAYECVNAITAEAYISTVWRRRGSLVWMSENYDTKTLCNSDLSILHLTTLTVNVSVNYGVGISTTEPC